MTSVNTNAAAITALRTLQQTNQSLDATQARISTGLKIGEAKDNAAYWAISTTLKSDNKSLGTVKDALGLGAATVDVAYQGLNKSKDVLDEIKAKLTAATQPGVDRDVIQAEIGELQKQLSSIATSSVFSGENWLSVDSSAVNYDATKKIVASFARDANNSVTIGTVDVSIGNVALFDSSTVPNKNGILDGMQNLKGADGKDLTIGGTASTTGNSNSVGLTAAVGTATATLASAAANGGTAVAGSVATSSGVQSGSAGTPSATYAFGTFSATGIDNGDTLTFNVTGGSAVSATPVTVALTSVTGSGTTGAGQLRTAISNALTTAGISGITVGGTGSNITLQAANSITIGTITANDANSNSTTTSNVGLSAGNQVASATPTAGTYAAGNFSATGLTAGDKMTFSFKVNGGAVQTKEITISGPSMTAGDVVTAFGSISGVTLTNPSGSALSFASDTGAGKSFELVDVATKDSAGRTKVFDALSTFVESKVGTVATGNLDLSGLAPTDTVSLNLTVDGAQLSTKVAVGANLAAFVANLNNDPTFAGKASAFVDGTALRINSRTTGAYSTVSIDAVSFATAAGAAKTPTPATGFNNLASSAVAMTSQFTSAVTLDDNDNIYFNIKLNDATASKLVTIDKALVNKTLTTDPTAPYTSGVIADANAFQSVVTAALAKAGISGVTVSVGTGGDAGKLVFKTDKVGTGAAITISDVSASQGANQMSIDKLDISDAGLAALNVTSGADISKVLSAYISVVNNAINQVTTAASNLGAVASRIDMQKTFVNTLMDTIDKGVGNLIDADMSEESTKLQALQVKQQLGVQALSIANQSSQNILSLFRG